MRIFVTGATGFLGINLLKLLAQQGHEIHALYRTQANTEALAGLGIHWHQGDLLDKDSLLAACPDAVDWFFHMAADTSMWSRNDAMQTRVNVEGTRNVIACALTKKVGRLIHTSSIAAYGIHHGQCIRENSPQLGGKSIANYYRTKFASETLVKTAVAEDNLDAVILNPCHLLGPWDSHNWSQMITMVANEALPAVPPGRGSFCHIRAIAEAHVAAAERGRTGENYILSGIDVSFEEFIQTIAKVVGKPVRKKPLPAWLLRFVATFTNAWSKISGKEPDLTPEKILIICDDMRVSSEKAQNELGYRADIPLATQIQDCYDWLCRQSDETKSTSHNHEVVAN